MAKSTTYKGAVKPFGKSGHFDESRRHSLQAKGIKTGHLVQPISYNAKYWSMDRDEKGKYKLTLGNLSDAGWFWDGDKEQLAGFMVRMYSSQVKDQFINTMKADKVDFESFKPDLLKSAAKGDGIYQLTGDNAKWHFGEDAEELESEEYELKSDETLTEAQRERIEELVYDEEYKGTDYDEFNKSRFYKNAKDILSDFIEASHGWDEFFSKMDDAKTMADESSIEFSNEEARDTVRRAMQKFKLEKETPAEQAARRLKEAGENPAQTKLR